MIVRYDKQNKVRVYESSSTMYVRHMSFDYMILPQA